MQQSSNYVGGARQLALSRVLLCILLACVCRPFGVLAEDELTGLGIEELGRVRVAPITSASRYLQLPAEASASVTVVTREEIRRFGYRTLGEILESVAGFYTVNDRNYTYLGVRGLSRPGDFNTRVLLLINGHRLNDGLYDTASVGENFILDVDLIEQVEVVRGPRSSLYGANAFSAIVNVVTRDAAEVGIGEALAGAGKFDTYKGRVSSGHVLGEGKRVLISATGYKSHGQDLYYSEFDTRRNDFGIAHDSDGEKLGSTFLDLKLEDFTIQCAANSREKKVPTSSFGTVFNDPRNKTSDDRAYVDVQWTGAFDVDTELAVRGFYDWVRYEGTYIYDYDTIPGLVSNRDWAEGRGLGSEITLTERGLRGHTVVAGLTGQFDTQQDQQNFDQDPYYLYLDSERDQASWAAYLQDDISLSSEFTFSLGARLDHFDSFGSFASPKAGILYRPSDPLIFKLLYGRAFRAPNAYERYYLFAPTAEQRSELDPEEIQSVELRAEYELQRGVTLAVSNFYFRAHDLIESHYDDANESNFYLNSGSVDVFGTELSIEGGFAGGVRVRSSYSYQDAQDRVSDQLLSNAPLHLAKVAILLPVVSENLWLGFTSEYRASVYSPRRARIDSYSLSNATLTLRELLPNLEVRGAVYNLFDERYDHAASLEHVQDGITQDGRSLFIELMYRLGRE